jgi:hypothetical protein
MCPKNPECNRIKLEKIVRGYNVGCACCEREFEVGPHRGRHEAHSIYCPRSNKFKEGAFNKRKRSSCEPTASKKVAPPALVTPKSVTIKNIPSIKAKKNKATKNQPLPDKIFLPNMPMDNDLIPPPPPLLFQKSVEIIPLPHEISPLITVDTYDLDALIGDLEKGTASSKETLERLQKIRRTAL